MQKYKQLSKFYLCLILTLLIRLIPFRVANVEPILTFLMPISKNFSYISSFLFAFLNILIFDLISLKFGTWTIMTSITYGAIGIVGSYLLRRNTFISTYHTFSIFGSLMYDIFTGIIFGSLIFNQPFIDTCIGQIPFSIMHISSSLLFAITASPLIEKFILTYEIENRYNFYFLKFREKT